MVFESRPYLLANQIQPYPWGARGDDAFIPRLLGIEAKADAPYAELWMGTHPNAPSQVVVDDAQVSLRQLVAQHPREILGEAVAIKFSGELPFLFKVLSTAEALSIQAHPTKEQARLLHARDPEHYPDDNHKPELAVALDSLTALIGFKPFSGILETLERYPELANFVGQEIAGRVKSAERAAPQQQKALLRELYATLVKRSVSCEEELVKATGRLAERLGLITTARDSKDAIKIEQDLMELFPQDSWTYLAHALIQHGRRICAARKPRCNECPLADDCPSAGGF